jgi:UDP-glucose:(heptosyl)LPS alpha-1,3-glucosyltransferase
MLDFPRVARQVSFALFSKRKLESQHFDIVHSHDRIFQMDILTMHGIPHQAWVRKARRKRPGLFDRSMAWVEKKGLGGPSVPMVLPVSSLAKEELVQVYDIPGSKIRVINPGIAVDRFAWFDQAACRKEVRHRFGLSHDDVVLLFVGMNFEIKRLELVVKGLAHWARRGEADTKLKLLVVGKGKQEPYLAIAREAGIAQRVVFAGVTDEVEPFYLASDIFAMPSWFDTFGLAVLEAMAAGLPVIISDKVGAKDLIRTGIEGFVLSADSSPSDFSEKLSVLRAESTRTEMGRNAKRVALQQSWEKVSQEVAALYRRLAAGER